MKYLVLVSHGGLAEGLKTSLAMFAGDKMDQVIAVGLKEGKSVDDFAVDFRESISGLTADDYVLDGDDLSATILSEARSALQPFEISAAGAEEDDDDI